MKSNGLLHVFTLLPFTLLIFACGGESGSENRETADSSVQTLMAAPDELKKQDCDSQKTLDLSRMPISYSEAQSREGEFRLRFRDRQFPDKDLSRTESLSFQDVQALIDNFLPDPALCKGNYYRGICINYGLDNNGLVYLYQPVLFRADSSIPDGYRSVKGSMYVYQNGAFSYRADSANLISNYRQRIEIRRTGAGNIYHGWEGNSGYSPDDNARCILYPQQELAAVYNANRETGGDANLYFFSAAKKDPRSSGGAIYKHEVLISAVSKWNVAANPQGFTNAVADMGHICPVTCGN
ncbi:MAG: hypothetical protein EOP49_08295 [Sphingobacteriales bacterium]|nr:MAG: hypothetical protein EOP49_08295 [Sphingobacteriales bacterium]